MSHAQDLKVKLAAIHERLGTPPGGRSWRSLEELAESEAFRELVREEFPAEAAGWPESVSRRKFLALMGASLALAGLNGCSTKPAPQVELVPYAHPPKELVPGTPLFFATSMTHAGKAVGLLVESQMGRPIKIEGNPDHPASLGTTDIFHQASVLTLYDPDRAKTPTHLGQTRTWGDAAAAIRQAMDKAARKKGAGFRLLSSRSSRPRWPDSLRTSSRHFPRRSGTFGSRSITTRPGMRADCLRRAGCAGLRFFPGRRGPFAGCRLFGSRRAQPPRRGRLHGPSPRSDRRAGCREGPNEPALRGRDRGKLHRGQGRPSPGAAAQDIEGVARAIAARLGVAAGDAAAQSPASWLRRWRNGSPRWPAT